MCKLRSSEIFSTVKCDKEIVNCMFLVIVSDFFFFFCLSNAFFFKCYANEITDETASLIIIFKNEQKKETIKISCGIYLK